MKIVWFYNDLETKARSHKDKLDFKVNKYFYIITISILLKYLYFLRITVYGTYDARVFIDSMSIKYIIIYLGGIAVVNSVFFILRGQAKLWYIFLLDLIVTVFVISDVLYYRGFNDFISLYAIKQGSNIEGLAASTLILFRGKDILFIIDLLIIAAILKKHNKINADIDIFKGVLYCVLGILIIALSISNQDFRERYNSWNKDNRMLVLGPINYHIKDLWDTWFNDKYLLTNEDKNEIRQWYEEKEPYVKDNWFGKFKGKNLIIIQVESLENFVINKKIGDQEITPNINKLIKQSIYFSNYRESTNNGNSSDSDLMTNAGVYPSRDGSVFFRFPTNEYSQSLPKVLEKMGYKTNAVKGCKGNFWNWKIALKSIGFNECLDKNSFQNGEIIGFILSDRDYFNQILDKKELFNEPFYNFFVTASSHSPFKIESRYHEIQLPDNLKDTRLGDYFHSIHYADKAIGEFINKLNERGTLENTVLVLYGDHTGPEKYFYDSLQAITDNNPWWLNNDKRIPLVIYSKNITPEERIINSSQVDLLPTILYLMGAECEEYKMAVGKNLFTSKNDFCILQDFTMVGSANEKQKEHIKKGLILNDKMIRSNYFKK